MLDVTRFGFTHDYQQIYDTVERYGREVLHPLCPKMDNEDWFPREEYNKLSSIGVLGITVPEKFGGAGIDEAAQALVTQAIARWNPSLSLVYMASDGQFANNLLRNGGDLLCEKYLPGICNGTLLGAIAMTEPGAGSDALGSMATKAVRDGDNYILNGRKIFITNGPDADAILVYAITSPELGSHGISAFIVEKDFPGFSVAQKLDKMGYRGSNTGELVFDDCIVPAENLVGEENCGVKILMGGLDYERVTCALHALGVAERALEISIDYSKMRKQFNQPIGSFQLVQRMLANMYTDIETTRALCYQVVMECSKLKAGETGRGEIHMRSAAIFLHASAAIVRVLNDAVQIHGGMGYMRETEINRLYRCSKLLEIGAGTREIRQLIIGRELVK